MICSDAMTGGARFHGHATHGGRTRIMMTRAAVCVSGTAPGSGDS